MRGFLKTLSAIDRVLTLVLKVITIAFFMAIALIVTANILLRIFPITSLHWTDEIVELSFAALVFYGAAGVWMTKGHFSVGDWFAKIVKSDRAKSAYRLVIELITLLFACVLFYYSMNLVIRSIELSSVFQIPKKVFYSPMPVASLIMIVYSIIYVIRAFIGMVSPRALFALDTGAGKAK
jgi:TRAP-type C4-dicarboxylate transport system permease small subunit